MPALRVAGSETQRAAWLPALAEGRSVATTMGLTPLDGVPMGTRPGALDPGVLLHLEQALGMTSEALGELLYHRSGLLGVSGLSADLRVLLASGKPAAREAVELFVHHVARAVGSLAVALEGLDALVFTAGIGEHAPSVRKAVCERLAWLGLALDRRANEGGRTRIDAPGSRIGVWIIPTDEEEVIARETARLAPGG